LYIIQVFLSRNIISQNKGKGDGMKKIINQLMKQKLIVSLVVFIFIASGFVAITRTNRESIPQLSLDMVTITTIYPGASPSETEELISIPIEKKLRKVGELDNVRSYNVENASVVVVFINDRAGDKKKTVQDIKDAVDQVDNLPSRAEKPLVKEITTDNTELISVAFTGKNGDVPYTRLREFANKSERYFYSFRGIGEVEKYGYFDREYLVEVDPVALEKYRIGMDVIVGVLAARNVDSPGGPLRIGRKEYVLRTKGQFRDVEEVRNTVIMSNDLGRVTRLKDVAKVSDTYEEVDVYRRFNGQPAIVFTLFKKKSADEIDLAGEIMKGIQTYYLSGYEDIVVTAFNDKSTTTKHRIFSVIEEAAVGFTILGLFMLMLLGRRMSLIVLGGIPVTFMITFTVMSYLGLTLNVVSLFGMIMVLGMVVDFSIVVSENSHRYMESGVRRAQAVSAGVSEVFVAVTTTLLCIIAAFMPLMLATGLIGKFIRSIPIVIITALIASWFIAMFILPTYLNIFLHEEKNENGGNKKTLFNRIAGLFRPSVPSDENKLKKTKHDNRVVKHDGGVFSRIQAKYKKLVSFSLRHRYAVVAVLFIIFAGSLALIPSIGFKFLTNGGEEEIRINVKLANETNLKTNLDQMKSIERIISKLPADELTAVHTWVGEAYSDSLDPQPGKASNKTTFDIFLTPEKERKRSADEIRQDLIGRIESLKSAGTIDSDVRITSDLVFLGPPVGKAVNVEISGDDYSVMKKISKEYIDYLATVKGLGNLSMDLEDGKTEYRYAVNEELASWSGVSTYDIAVALNASFQGVVATKVSANQEEQGVRVRFEENARSKMNGIHDVKVSTRMGGLVPLDSVTTVRKDPAYSQINRLNFSRLVQVQADLDPSIITSGQVTTRLLEKFGDIEKRYPGYHVRYGGEQEDTDKSMSELGNLFIGALIVIFLILTVFFRSFLMPLIVMIAIPFALVGVVFAQFTHHVPLSFMSMLGLFSLAGIIVSNTLVLVQFINKFRVEGLGIKEAIAEGGVVRLRPIILTAGAMILELLPVIYGVGGKDYLVAPLALAFGYGLIFATFITLIIVPCFYHIADDFKRFASLLLSRVNIRMSPSLCENGKTSRL
jgi:multidrug efflux pump subunit AcrB